MTKHNLQTLRGWLRLWRKGYTLKGRNVFQTFELSYQEMKHIVLLSVVDGQNAFARYHETEFKELRDAGYKVSLCATVPESVLIYLAQKGGGIRDLLNFVDVLRAIPWSLEEQFAKDVVQGMHEDAIRASLVHEVKNGAADDPNLETLARMLQALKFSSENTVHSKDGNAHFDAGACQSFNDLAWTDWFRLTGLLYDLSSQILDVKLGEYGPRAVDCLMRLDPYSFVIRVTASISHPEQMTSLFELEERGETECPDYPPQLILLALDLGSYMFTFGLKQQRGPTRTTTLLERWLTEQTIAGGQNLPYENGSWL